MTPDVIKILPKLEYVHCMNFEFTDEHIMYSCNLKELICGNNTFFTDLSLKKLTKLEIFKISEGNLLISEEVLTNMIYLKELHCGRLQIYDKIFKKLPELKKLNCDFNVAITDAGLLYLSNLEELHCGQNINFTDNGLSKLTNLTYLNCNINTNITDVTICSLPKLNKLSCGINRNFVNGLKIISDKLTYIDRTKLNDDFTNHINFMNIFNKIKTKTSKYTEL